MKTNKTAWIKLRVTPEEKADLAEQARRRGLTLSRFLVLSAQQTPFVPGGHVFTLAEGPCWLVRRRERPNHENR